MNAEQIAGLLVGLGIGGAVGAVAAVVVAASRLKASVDDFGMRFRAYIAGKTDPDSVDLAESFTTMEAGLARLLDSVNKARRAFTPRR